MCEQKEKNKEKRIAFWQGVARYTVSTFLVGAAIIAITFGRWSLASVPLIMLAWLDLRELMGARTAELRATYEAFMASMRVVQHTTDISYQRIVGIHALVDRLYREQPVGFALVIKAINNLPLPGLPGEHKATKGTLEIMSRFRFTEDQPNLDVTFGVKDIKSAKGTPVDAGDIDLSAESNSDAISATVSDQQLSEDRMSVTAKLTLAGGSMPEPGLAVITVKGTNRDTGAVVAAGTAEFQTGPGEGALGSIQLDIPLTPIDEAPAAPVEQPAPAEAPFETEQPAPAPVDGSGDPV